MHNSPEQSAKSLKLARQSAGTLQKVLSMIEENEYCPDIIQQIDSVIGLLKSSRKELLTGHLGHCLEKNISRDKQKTIDELLKIYSIS